MKEKKDCKIIQDLLPNYIENLTNVETNKFIEEHLENCQECKEILNDMKSNINISDKKREKKEIKFIKKYNKKIKTLQLIIILIVMIYILIIGRKMFILGDLKSKIGEQLNKDNYYQKIYSYSGEQVAVEESYVKSKKYFYKILIYPSNSERMEYYDGVKANIYSSNDKEKIAILNKETDDPYSLNLIKIQNYLYTTNPFDFIKMALNSSIIAEECNGKMCYRINKEGQILFIDKDTGLPVRTKMTSTFEKDGKIVDIVNDYFYKFDSVTDNNFIEPDISNYDIK